MSTTGERIALPGGGWAVPNGDGTYTVTGLTGDEADLNGHWVPYTGSTPELDDAYELIEDSGNWFVKG